MLEAVPVNVDDRDTRRLVTDWEKEGFTVPLKMVLLHNHSALRLKGRLLFQPGVMVTSVPWQLASSARVHDRGEDLAPGAVRR